METVEILGITLEKSGYFLNTIDNSFMIAGVNDDEQGFIFYNTPIEKFKGFFEKYKCGAVGYFSHTENNVIDLNTINEVKTIWKFGINITKPTTLLFDKKTIKLSSIKELMLSGLNPKYFPSMSTMIGLRVLEMDDCDDFLTQNNELISNSVIDLKIKNVKNLDLKKLAVFPSIKRLRLYDSELKSIDGIESLENLETLEFVNIKKIKDLTPVLKVGKLKNVGFEKIPQVKDWDFLADRDDLSIISLPIADSIEFYEKFSNLEYFYCRKVIDRGNNNFLFSKTHHKDIMTKAGIQVNYIARNDVFLQPIE